MTAFAAATAILVCPSCHASITENALEQFVCGVHGVVAVRKLGAVDFLCNRGVLGSAAGGSFDLEEDEAKARELSSRIRQSSFRELQRWLAGDLPDHEAGRLQSLAVRRFNASYARVEEEVALSAGEAILNKVNPHLAERGFGPVHGDIALEAGGGHGLHLPTFSSLFNMVVFLDCSLVHLMMGAKLAEETGIATMILYVRGDATALPFATGSLDFVHEAGVIEHVERPDRLVAEALRVLSRRGTYVCLSPNRYPLSPEPHFKLPLFGLFPRALRKRLIPLTRGIHAEDGTELLSLSALRRTFREAGEKDVPVYFLPRHLPETVRKTFLRRLIHGALRLPLAGALLSLILNRVLLPVMPYHIAVVTRREPNDHRRQG